MQTSVAKPRPTAGVSKPRVPTLLSWIRFRVPTLAECAIALLSALCLIVAFPNFDLWLLAWAGFIPLLLVIARRPAPWSGFFLGWLFGAVFFYGTCYWLTYSMIHFAGIPAWIAFAMLIPGAIILGLFPAMFAMMLATLVRKMGHTALLLAPVIWPALEWARLEATGQLWNAVGYSQAYHPVIIQVARYGGVYAVGFLILLINAGLALVFVRRDRRSLLLSGSLIAFALVIVFLARVPSTSPDESLSANDPVVIALQPNVPMDLIKSTEDMARLNERHFAMSETVLRSLPNDGSARLLVWPESPMNFTYGTDALLRERLQQFAKLHRTSILLNSQESAPNDGLYNSALLINQEGSLVSQYDKIRLLPFGEYVPLPTWVPGAGLIRGIVGDFTAGSSYRLMPIGNVRAGVFICIESAYPTIARRFTDEGADVLINISNDGYLGPTAVMRQHLANAIFRAVENGRPVLRVTNTGITARISANGQIHEITQPFQQDVRIWRMSQAKSAPSFYAANGDLFVTLCLVISALALIWLFIRRRSDAVIT
jgi:apolipoprotein N-acyltransferase